MPDRLWDTQVWVSDSRRLQAGLGWQPRYAFEQGFRMMADWIRDNPAVRNIYCNPV